MTARTKDIGKQFGLYDEDLKTPGHDALLLWVDRHREFIARNLTHDTHAPSNCVWELPIRRQSFIVGYWDAWIELRPITDDPPQYFRGIGIEIKTQIPSLGELVRQLRTYEACSVDRQSGIICVVSPDSRWAQQLRSQGFAYIDPAAVTVGVAP